MIGYVYKLICPLKNQPIYVGSTVKFPNVRLCEHMTWSRRQDGQPIHAYIKENNITPKIEVLEKIELEYGKIKPLREAEAKWRTDLFLNNAPLLNAEFIKKDIIKVPYRSIKIKENHYEMVRQNKMETGVPIEFFIGQAIEEKFEREKPKSK